MFLFLLATALAQGGDRPAVVMVLHTKGNVTLERADNSARRVGPGEFLSAADHITTAADAEATLLFLATGSQVRVKPSVQATIEVNRCTPERAVEILPRPQLPPRNLEGLRELSRSSRGAVGILRSDTKKAESYPAITPIEGSTILTDRPTLTWTPVPKATGYLVELLSGAEGRDQRILWRANTKEPRLTYPEKEKPLTFGSLYRWRVSPMMGEDRAEPMFHARFFVITKTELTALESLKPLVASSSPADLLLAAAGYEAHGVYGEALRLYERLAKLVPGEPNYQRALVSYYMRAGITRSR